MGTAILSQNNAVTGMTFQSAELSAKETRTLKTMDKKQDTRR